MSKASSDLELTASQQDYLVAIFRIVRENHVARAKEIGARLKVRRSSVTGALHVLADRGLIHYAPYDAVTLTDLGWRLAEQYVRRQEILRSFFERVLAVPGAEAAIAACKIEHAVSESLLVRLVEFIEFAERCPQGGAKWHEGAGYSCREPDTAQACERCTQSVLENIRAGKPTRKQEWVSGALGRLQAEAGSRRGGKLAPNGTGSQDAAQPSVRAGRSHPSR